MDLPKRPKFNEYEPRLYQMWEEKGYFTPEIDPDKKPFSILLPPPNANAPLHAGHAVYVVEDILARFHRMLGDPTLFLPGTDHAGIETQFVLEKHLREKGTSRLDYDRETLYEMIHEFVEENRGTATTQLRRLGFSLDWTREKYTLEPEILSIVLETFRKIHEDGLLYRDERLVSYCTHCGTGYSNLEVDHDERTDHIYHLNYGPVTIATTRPETIFADVAIAVHPDDPKNKDLIGKTATIPLINKEIPIIGDEAVDPEFGTGALKITPGHDPLDFEVGERHNLERISVVDRSGAMINVPEEFLGMNVSDARTTIVERLKDAGTMVGEEPIEHAVSICYRCKNVIEPLLVPQWYVTIEPFVQGVLKALEAEEIKLYPERFKDELIHWLETAPDWNISRQIVWGPRIPVWYDLDANPQIELTFLDDEKQTVHGTWEELKEQYRFDEIQNGLQELVAPIGSSYELDPDENHHMLQETDTFDTWFSSGQWPLTTLGYPDSEDFKYFYPTTVLDTMWDILPFWIMRMLMLGIYRTGEVPFEWAHLHARVVDADGKKMSKSRGNVVNPMEVVEEYGADALRFALVFGVAPAADVALGDEKLTGMRNFITKIWNVCRYTLMLTKEYQYQQEIPELQDKDTEILDRLNQVIEKVTRSIDTFQFSHAAEELHEFLWNDLASDYLESTKDRDDDGAKWTLLMVVREYLKLLHPFMPYVTEEIYQTLPNKDAESIMISKWPEEIDKLST